MQTYLHRQKCRREEKSMKQEKKAEVPNCYVTLENDLYHKIKQGLAQARTALLKLKEERSYVNKKQKH